MFKYAHFAALTANELHNVLMEKGVRPAEREQIKAEVAAYKESRRREKITKAKFDSLWRELLEPLSNEQRVVYNVIRYAKTAYPNPERMTALLAYQKVLSTLNRKLRTHWQAYTNTPTQIAVDKKLPNKGQHWTDWVPPKVKSAIIEAFEAIPPRYKAKAKQPFERKISKADNSKRKLSLIRAVKNAMNKTEREIATLNDLLKGESNDELEHAKEELKRQTKALSLILALDDESPLPRVWQELV